MNCTRNPVGWFEIYVQNLDRAKAFYEKVFAITLATLPSPDPQIEMLVFPPPMSPDLPGCGGALAKMPGKDPGAGGTIIYFSCEDCAVETARAAAHGGSVNLDKMPIGEYGFISLIQDTEGNIIGLHSMK